MRNLFDNPDACHCREIGVVVDNAGYFRFCTCAHGAREQVKDGGGFGPYIGRQAIEVVSELQNQLKEKSLAH